MKLGVALYACGHARMSTTVGFSEVCVHAVYTTTCLQNTSRVIS